MTFGRAIRIGAITEAVLVGILAASGLYLTWFYRPDSPYLNVFSDSHLDTEIRITRAVRALHNVCGSASVWIGLALAVACVVGAFQRSPLATKRSATLGSVFAIIVLLASFTGYLLPWDQLALKAVTINGNLGGMRAIFSDNVRFAILGNREIPTATLQRWFLAHTIVLGPLLGLTLWSFLRKPKES